MRQLPTKEREAIINEVRLWMSNKTLCPFYFEKDFARVISGEEEGIYGWCVAGPPWLPSHPNRTSAESCP
jgi:hypothetical protein